MEKIKLMYKAYSINVYHKQGETNEKLVFLHGGGLDNAMLSWKEVIELMESEYDIYAVDMLGYGNSSKPDIVYSIPMYTELIYDVLRQLNIERTHLVGLSLGGGVALAVSLKYPQKVDKLVLVDSHGLSDRTPFHAIGRWLVNSKLYSKSNEWLKKSKKMIRWSMGSVFIGDNRKITDELISELYDLCKDPEGGKPFESLQRYEMGRKKVTTDLSSHLNELKMPVLIVNGEKDAAVPTKSAVAASQVIENSQLYIMKGCKHWPQKERPEEFVKVLEEFLHRT